MAIPKVIHPLSLCFFLLLANVSFGKLCLVADNSLTTGPQPSTLEEECSETEYRSYVNCIRRRSKRYIESEQCEEGLSCDGCDCNLCSYSECSNQCSQCCDNYTPPCTTRSCCQATCHSTCRTSHCRRNCRTRCANTIGKTVMKEATHTITSGSAIATGGKLESLSKHNITTVINLHNVINNTNVVDIPVSINSTNYNNITLEAGEPGAVNVELHNPAPYPSQSSTHFIPMYPPQEPPPPVPEEHKPPVVPEQPCCYMVYPRQCVPATEPPFSKCFNEKKHICSDVCRSSIMHAEPYRVCDESIQRVHSSGSRCHEQVAYIPQPQPRCFSTPAWPYVQCSIASANCQGCYRHVVDGGAASSSCSPACYQGGTNVGPYYPIYQPSFNIPSYCGTGGCLPFVGGSGMQGWNSGFAVQSIDKTFGYEPQDLQAQHGGYNYKRSVSERSDSDTSVEYSVEEIPVKLETV